MKKTEFISFRCSEKIKNLIEADSIEKEWTISHTVEKILTEYYERKNRKSKADCTKYTFLYIKSGTPLLQQKCTTFCRLTVFHQPGKLPANWVKHFSIFCRLTVFHQPGKLPANWVKHFSISV